LKAGHDCQPTTRAQHLLEAGKLLNRVMEMFDGFGAGNKVVESIKQGLVRRKKRIKEAHVVAGRREYFRKHWYWAASVIQAILARRQLFQQGIDKL